MPRGQSSPGNVHSVQQLSKGIRQIPQLSSLAIHRQVATLTQSGKPRKMQIISPNSKKVRVCFVIIIQLLCENVIFVESLSLFKKNLATYF